jgi:hypothetical protein
LLGAINVPQIADARVLLRRSSCLDEVGDRDGSQQSNDGHNDHDLHQRKTRLGGCVYLHRLSFFSRGVNAAADYYYYEYNVFTYCLPPTAQLI